MAGETQLEELLLSMNPTLHAEAYGIVLDAQNIFPKSKAFAVIAEEEGVTIIATIEALQGAEIVAPSKWARITLTIHSSLDAVGLTAAFATALKDVGISANVIAGFYHDHIFVPWGKGKEAVNALNLLSRAN